jgi:hypothetical protein
LPPWHLVLEFGPTTSGVESRRGRRQFGAPD